MAIEQRVGQGIKGIIGWTNELRANFRRTDSGEYQKRFLGDSLALPVAYIGFMADATANGLIRGNGRSETLFLWGVLASIGFGGLIYNAHNFNRARRREGVERQKQLKVAVNQLNLDLAGQKEVDWGSMIRMVQQKSIASSFTPVELFEGLMSEAGGERVEQ